MERLKKAIVEGQKLFEFDYAALGKKYGYKQYIGGAGPSVEEEEKNTKAL